MKDKTAREFWSRVDGKLGTSTLRDLCSKAGINYNSVRNRKSGPVYSLPRIETGYAISKALGVSMEYLLTGSQLPNTRADRVYSYLQKNMPGLLQDILAKVEKNDGSSGTKVS